MSPYVIVALVGGLVFLWAIVSFNRFISQRNLIANSWSNVDTELRRRYDLVPNLVETVSGYAAHEKATLTEVIEARAGAVASQGDASEQAEAENILVQGLRHLMAVSEDYPELVASAHFLDLQRELVITENRIQASRRLFNGNVRDYNRRVESIPSRIIAAIGRFPKADYFEVEPAVREARSPSSTNTF